jgi:hypothetical protein
MSVSCLPSAPDISSIAVHGDQGSESPESDGPGSDGPGYDDPGSDGPGTDGPGSAM